MVRILFVGGGSIGHVAPCIAVWRAIQEHIPSVQAHFICAERSADREFLTREGVPFTALPLPRRSAIFPLTFLHAYWKASVLLRAFEPHMLLGKGGALSIPVCLAAKRRGIPIVLHESDAVVGRANRFLSHFAETVCLGFPSGEGRRVKEYRQRTVVTGNPVRPEITRGSREEGLRITGFSGKRPVLLIVGGSQGAQALNEIVVQKLSELATLCDIVHIAGKGKTRGAPQQSYFAIEFANEELPHLYALASLAISRAGAGSLSELAANGIPTILVPLRGVAHDHQGVNAERAQESGGCILIEQEGLPRALVPLVRELLADRGRLHALAEKIRTLNRQDAATNIARMLLDLCM